MIYVYIFEYKQCSLYGKKVNIFYKKGLLDSASDAASNGTRSRQQRIYEEDYRLVHNFDIVQIPMKRRRPNNALKFYRQS